MLLLRGRNAKGTKRVQLRLQEAEIAIQHANGRMERRLAQVVDMAEAIARALRSLPDGARILAGKRRLTGWNAHTSEFQPVCQRCGTQDLILERVRHGDVLERHA